jgi:hypothetical protein
MSPFSAWIFAILIAIASPEKRDDYQKQLLHPSISPGMQARAGLPDARETKEEGEARYREIATDLDAVLSTEKPLFGGKNGKIWTAAVMLSFMKLESGLRLDVDKGKGKWGRGDYGRSFCLMQLKVNKVTIQIAHPEMGTWTGLDVVTDRKKCFRAGLEMLRRSIGACQTGTNAAGEVVPLTMADRFSAYATGKCSEKEPESRMKWSVASKMFDRWKALAPTDPQGPKDTPRQAPTSPPVPALPKPASGTALAENVSKGQEHLANHLSECSMTSSF